MSILPPFAGSPVRLETDQANRLALQFAAVARDPKGNMVETFRKILDGKLTDSQVVQVREKGILFGGEMDLQPGEYTLSFAVLDQMNDVTGSVPTPLKVQ
jgi:hypothetical protein